MEFLAKNYIKRKDLESDIMAQVGGDIEGNKASGNTIKGTRAELKKLQLSDTTTVFGCKVVASDKTTTEILQEKVKHK